MGICSVPCKVADCNNCAFRLFSLFRLSLCLSHTYTISLSSHSLSLSHTTRKFTSTRDDLQHKLRVTIKSAELASKSVDESRIQIQVQFIAISLLLSLKCPYYMLNFNLLHILFITYNFSITVIDYN